jgi:hypothetical protein
LSASTPPNVATLSYIVWAVWPMVLGLTLLVRQPQLAVA